MSSRWSAAGSIRGPEGPQGPQGPPGPAGAALPQRESLLFGYSNGRVASVTGQTTSRLLSYNPDGTLQQVLRLGPDGQVTATFFYDAARRLLAISVED